MWLKETNQKTSYGEWLKNYYQKDNQSSVSNKTVSQSKNAKGDKQAEVSGSLKHYSLSEKADSDFARAVDDIANGGVAGRQHITLGTMPDVFKLIGLPDSRVNIRRDTIQKSNG